MGKAKVLAIIAAVFVLFGGIFFFRRNRRQSGQIGYEEQFVQRYQYFWTNQLYLNPQQFIPLSFKEEDVQTLLRVCTKYKSIFNPSYTSNKMKVKKFQPKVQTKRLGFRSPNTANYPPVRVKCIRCTLKYGFIDLGTGVSGFVIEKDQRGNTTGDNELFYIRDEFLYKGKKPYSNLLPASDTTQPFPAQMNQVNTMPGNQGQMLQQGYQPPMIPGQTSQQGYPSPTIPGQTPQQGYQPQGQDPMQRPMQTGDYNSQMRSGPSTPVDGSMPFNPVPPEYQQTQGINTYPNGNPGQVTSYPPNIQPTTPQSFQPPLSPHGYPQAVPVLMPPPQVAVHQ